MNINKKGQAYLSKLAQSGQLEPEVVVNDASSPKHPLHGFFDWDDASAGHKYRIDQARKLIRSVKVEIVNKTSVLRAPKYVHDPKAGKKQSYVEVAAVKSDRERSRDIVMAELRQAVSHLRRANQIASALDLEDEMEGLIAMATNVMEEVESRASE